MNQSQAGSEAKDAAELPAAEGAAPREAGQGGFDYGTEWKDGVPVSQRFDDPYFSFGGGLDETRHVFLAGNDLPARFRDGLSIAELGFGTGLNLLATALDWERAGALGRFRFTSFEAFPLTSDDLGRALQAFPEVTPLAPALLGAWQRVEALAKEVDFMAETRCLTFALGAAEVELILGDARHALPAWQGRADIWYLDGFSPARNPELWGEGLMLEVAKHSAPGASFATYTAAGHVRRALEAAGFDVQRAPGYGRKRHMSRGTLKDDR